MKLTLTNIKKMKTNSTPLQKRVINYIVDEWSNYDDITSIKFGDAWLINIDELYNYFTKAGKNE